MAVMITDTCVNCDLCIDECPAAAIVSPDENPLFYGVFTYVRPERCVECVDEAVPKCAQACPSEGCIVWDMPYTEAYNDHFLGSDDYVIHEHKKKGLLSPIEAPRPFRETITSEQRVAHASVGETLELHKQRKKNVSNNR